MSRKFLLIASYSDSLLNFRGPLLHALIAAKLEIHVAVPHCPEGDEIRRDLENMGVRVHEIILQRTGRNPLVDLISLHNLWRLMVNIKPDLMLAYTVKPVIYGCFAAMLAQVPSRFALITGLGYAFQGGSWMHLVISRGVQWLYRVALSKVDKVFFQNSDDEALFNDLDIVNKKRVDTLVVNGSGVDLSRFAQVPLPVIPRFLLIARLLGSKGVREYVEAARKIRAQNPHVRFGLVGWIDENPDAITKVELEQWITSGSVDYYGQLDDVRPALEECGIFVLPSYREGTPRTVLEAMAMGRPIITTTAPGCRETVIHEYNGFLVPTKSVNDLVIAMMKFIQDPTLVSRMGTRSRLIAEEKYDVLKINEQMLRAMGLKC